MDIFLVDLVGGLVGLAGLLGWTPEVLAITPTRSIEGAGRGGLKFSHLITKKILQIILQTLGAVSVAGSSLCCMKKQRLSSV